MLGVPHPGFALRVSERQKEERETRKPRAPLSSRGSAGQEHPGDRYLQRPSKPGQDSKPRIQLHQNGECRGVERHSSPACMSRPGRLLAAPLMPCSAPRSLTSNFSPLQSTLACPLLTQPCGPVKAFLLSSPCTLFHSSIHSAFPTSSPPISPGYCSSFMEALSPPWVTSVAAGQPVPWLASRFFDFSFLRIISSVPPDLKVPTRRTFLDPQSCGDPLQAVHLFAKELDVKSVTLERSLGAGKLGAQEALSPCGSPIYSTGHAYSVHTSILKPTSTQVPAWKPCLHTKPTPSPPSTQKVPALADYREEGAEGRFGELCCGCLQLPGRQELPVAVHTLRDSASDSQRLGFLAEALTLGQFDHSHIVRLEGVVTRGSTLMIVTEYMSHGALDGFLRRHEGQLMAGQLMGLLPGLASAMKYLSEMGYIHRGLAARRVLVSSDLVCKISGFGRGPRDRAEAVYTTMSGRSPALWAAPETLQFGHFSSASDVWSFGIVMWEVMAFGERPYWDMSGQDVSNLWLQLQAF
ncbi:hypothetical protein P7K49_015994 [Saguinus oedipus]|uniref:Protein kinase domain-containing protein n=1 Tax=Saguinus oedipus TaxID=9490 RepID=A0ABQ9VBD9_SAGOE|nr:hypothetical protein P7K49_015994 [Saguinus oedipus]